MCLQRGGITLNKIFISIFVQVIWAQLQLATPTPPGVKGIVSKFHLVEYSPVSHNVSQSQKCITVALQIII